MTIFWILLGGFITSAAGAHVVEVELPSRFHQTDLVALSAEDRRELNLLTEEAVRRKLPQASRTSATRRAPGVKGEPEGCGGIVVYTRNGQPWLPNAERVKKSPALYRAGETSNDLTFTYNSTPAWTTAELSLLQNTVALAYPVMRSLMGPPAFANTVNFRKPVQGEYSAFYVPYFNEIVLANATVNHVIHEMAHAFRDDFIVSGMSIPYEEGMARGPEIVVFRQLGSVPDPLFGGYTYYTDQLAHIYYEAFNQWGQAPHLGQIESYNPDAQYEWSAMVWIKCWVEDPEFFKKFHAAYYVQRATKASFLTPSELNAVVAQSKPTVEGETTATWLERQWITKYGPHEKGYVLRMGVANTTVQVTPVFSYRNGSSIEEFRSATITVRVYNAASQLFGQVTKHFPSLSTGGGSIMIKSGGDIDSGAYTGRIMIVASTAIEDHLLSATTYAALGNGGGPLFGVVTNGNSGTIEIPGMVSTQVVNGMFQLSHPLLTSSGSFTVRYTNENNQVFTRTVAKDTSDYFLFPDFAYPEGAPFNPPVTVTTAPPPVTVNPPPTLTLMNNLFNPTQGQVVTISWELQETLPVTVEVRDSTGMLLATLVNETQGSGSYSTRWSGQNHVGETVASGVYLACLRTSRGTVMKKMIIIK